MKYNHIKYWYHYFLLTNFPGLCAASRNCITFRRIYLARTCSTNAIWSDHWPATRRVTTTSSARTNSHPINLNWTRFGKLLKNKIWPIPNTFPSKISTILWRNRESTCEAVYNWFSMFAHKWWRWVWFSISNVLYIYWIQYVILRCSCIHIIVIGALYAGPTAHCEILWVMRESRTIPMD